MTFLMFIFPRACGVILALSLALDFYSIVEVKPILAYTKGIQIFSSLTMVQHAIYDSYNLWSFHPELRWSVDKLLLRTF